MTGGSGGPAAPYAHVVVCMDRSEAAALGLREARRLRALGPGHLTILHVATAPLLVGYSRWGVERQIFHRRARRWLSALAAGVPQADPVLLWGHPAERIIEWAREAQPDLLVAASHASRAERVLGSTVRRLAMSASCTVLLLPPGLSSSAPEGEGAPYGHIACCVDDSDASRRALAEALRLRALGPGRLSLVHVAPTPLIEVAVPGGLTTSPRDIAASEGAWLRRLAATTPGADAVSLDGVPVAAAAEWAGREGPDLIVAAAHRGPLERAMLGSFAAGIALDAPCPVLLTH